MFQGGATNLKHWNEYTKSKFLDRLKTLGSIYTYQDKTYSIFHKIELFMYSTIKSHILKIWI